MPPRTDSDEGQGSPGHVVHPSSVGRPSRSQGRVAGSAPCRTSPIRAGTGRAIPDPGFAGDDGSADPDLRGGARGVRRRPGTAPRRCSSRCSARGCWSRSSPCSARSRSTRRGWPTTRPATWPRPCSPAATGGRRCWRSPASQTLAAWRPDARPVPVAARWPPGRRCRRGRPRSWSTWPARRRTPSRASLLDGLARGWPLAGPPTGRSGRSRPRGIAT